MRLFRSEEEVPDGGATMPVKQLQRLATCWYGDRLDADWQPRTIERSQAILEALGLTGDFWRLR